MLILHKQYGNQQSQNNITTCTTNLMVINMFFAVFVHNFLGNVHIDEKINKNRNKITLETKWYI